MIAGVVLHLCNEFKVLSPFRRVFEVFRSALALAQRGGTLLIDMYAPMALFGFSPSCA